MFFSILLEEDETWQLPIMSSLAVLEVLFCFNPIVLVQSVLIFDSKWHEGPSKRNA